MVPDLDGPVSAAGDEYLRVVVVPGYLVDRHVVGIKGLQELAGVGLRTLVHLALLRTHQKQVVCLWVEVEGRSATCNTPEGILQWQVRPITHIE